MKKEAFYKLFQFNGSVFLLILILVAASLTNVLNVNAETTNEYEVLRSKWYDYLTGGTLSQETLDNTYVQDFIHKAESTALTYWKSMDTSTDRKAIWNEKGYTYIPKSTPYFSNTYSRLRKMALAYKLDGSSLKNNTELRDDIISAMDWVYENWYNPSIVPKPPCFGNWFDFQIASPKSINDIVILMYDDFSSDQIDNYMDTILHYNPMVEYGGNGGRSPMAGGNLIWKSIVKTLAGANKEIAEPLNDVRKKLPRVFTYWTKYPSKRNGTFGDGGFYEDGSYIAHYANSYSGGYGLVLMGLIPSITNLLTDSPWEIDNPNMDNIYDWIYDTYEPLIYKGIMMDMTRGRNISKFSSIDRSAGLSLARAFLEIAQTAPVDDKERIESMVKYWIESNSNGDIRSSANIYQLTLIKDLLDSSTASRGLLNMSHSYNMMNQIVHRQSDFALGLSMHSSNIENYEVILEENLHGWYTHNSTTYLYNNDLTHYTDNYWPTINPYRMPGTTVDTRRLSNKKNHDKKSSSTWVGGTTYDSKYTVAGMEINDIGTSLKGFKSWFMFDDEIVALGSGITSSDNRTIETIVENRRIKLDRSNNVTVNGDIISLSNKNKKTESNVEWVHLQGNVPDSDIGYYFPDSSTVNLLKEERQGSWKDINKYVKSISKEVLCPIEDAFVNDGVNADTNYGQEKSLRVKDSKTPSYSRFSILKFDLTGIADAANLKLRIYGRNSQNNEPITIKAYGTTDNSWDENSITWNNAPEKISDILDSITVNNDLKYYEWDVSKFAKDQLKKGETHISIILESDAKENLLFNGLSKERDKYKPNLFVTVPVYSRSYFNVWLDHGKNPTNENYAYVLLPNKSKEATAVYADNPDIEIISANNNVHAVKETKLNVTGINYLHNNNSKISGIMSSHKSSIIYKEDSSELDMYISDPTKRNTNKITFTMDKTADSVISKDDKITVVQLNPYIILEADVKGAMGKAFNIKLKNPQDVEEGEDNPQDEENKQDVESPQDEDDSQDDETQVPKEIYLSPTKDTYVRRGKYSDTNYGDSTLLRIKHSPKVDNTRNTYLQFDLSNIDSVSKATLKMYGKNTETSKAITINAYGVEDDSWGENTVTWNNRPLPNTNMESSAKIDSTEKYYSFDVTSFVSKELNGDKTVTFMLRGINKEDDIFHVYSKERGGNIPQLVITE